MKRLVLSLLSDNVTIVFVAHLKVVIFESPNVISLETLDVEGEELYPKVIIFELVAALPLL